MVCGMRMITFAHQKLLKRTFEKILARSSVSKRPRNCLNSPFGAWKCAGMQRLELKCSKIARISRVQKLPQKSGLRPRPRPGAPAALGAVLARRLCF